jgi:MFS family permease
MVESTLGRRLSLASSTFATAFACIAFALADGPWAVRTSTLAVSLAATTMWAVLYGWTPEVFATEVRSSACGVASALSRVGGMTAPLVGSALLAVDRTWPVYCSILVFGAATLSVLLLRGGEERRGQYGALH